MAIRCAQEVDTYRTMSSFGGIHEVESGKYTLGAWIVRELGRCLIWIELAAARDGIKANWWEYEISFCNKRWDIWIEVIGKPGIDTKGE